MVENVRKVSIFLSSPGNLSAEREIATEVCQLLNLDLGRSEKFNIELIKWETHTHSARGESTQEVINDQIGDEYDIFLGVFGARFGTPTKAWGSGTEEEFRLAKKRSDETSKPKMMFLFSNKSHPLDEIDAAQLTRVQSFKEDLSRLGVLYFGFKNETQFRTLLYSQLIQTVRAVLKASDSKKPGKLELVVPNHFDPLASYNALLETDSEVHASVMLGRAGKFLQQASIDLNKMTKSLLTFANTLKVPPPSHPVTNMQTHQPS